MFQESVYFECNSNETSRSESTSRETPYVTSKKPSKSSHKVQQIQGDGSESDNEASAHTMAGPPPKLGNPPTNLKFPCPVGNHKHKVSSCAEFFNFTPLDRWEKIDNNRMCYTCLKPRTVCKGRKCLNTESIPELLKSAVCASWVESKGLSLFSIFFCKQKQHGDSRAQVSDLKKELEKYIGIWEQQSWIQRYNFLLTIFSKD